MHISVLYCVRFLKCNIFRNIVKKRNTTRSIVETERVHVLQKLHLTQNTYRQIKVSARRIEAKKTHLSYNSHYRYSLNTPYLKCPWSIYIVTDFVKHVELLLIVLRQDVCYVWSRLMFFTSITLRKIRTQPYYFYQCLAY